MKLIIVISVIYITVTIRPGATLKCYHCGIDLKDSFSKQMCGDPFYKNDSLLVDCESSEYIGCAKVDIGVPGFPDKIIAIARSCVSYEMLRKFKEMKPKVGSLEFCDTDGCNSSQSLKSSASVMVLIVLVKFLFYRFH